MRMLALASTLKKVLFGAFRVLRCDEDGSLEVVQPSGGSFDVFLQDQTTPSVNLYLYKTAATPTLTAAAEKDDTELAVDSNAGVSDRHAITIREGSRFFQSLVKSSTANDIVLASPLDAPFTTDAVIEVGPWNMNLNGSGGTLEFSVCPPPGADFDIYGITVSIVDDTAMDSGKFGGIAALANGFVLRVEDGWAQNLGLYVNNLGFGEQGFDTRYDPKAPAGVFGVIHSHNVREHDGVAIRLYGSSGDCLKALIRDDLFDLLQIVVVVSGHVVLP